MVTRTDYTGDAVQAARSVLLEVTRLLGAYRDRLVLVGGWVPGLLLPDAEPRHVGSLDIDLALDHRRLGEPEYRTIRELLAGRGYEQDDRQPFIFRRCVTIHGREIRVEVDLLAGEYEGTGKSRRTQKVHDVRPRKARGCDLAFDMAAEVELHGTLPNGAQRFREDSDRHHRAVPRDEGDGVGRPTEREGRLRHPLLHQALSGRDGCSRHRV